MSRWEPDAAGRLREAALELFVEQGYGATTVPQIAERAGLTTRTFFRYFPDKREVLFDGEDDLPGLVAQVFREADPSLTPLELVVDGLRTVVAPRFSGLHGALRARRRVVAADPALRERELHKLDLLTSAATTGFRARGLDDLHAEVAGQLAGVVWATALQRWLDAETETSFADAVSEAAAALAEISR